MNYQNDIAFFHLINWWNTRKEERQHQKDLKVLGTDFNSKMDMKLNSILEEHLKSGIKTYKEDTFISTIQFNDGYSYHFWDANKYYAWLCRGKFLNINDDIIYNYENKRPSLDVMLNFKNSIDDYVRTY